MNTFIPFQCWLQKQHDQERFVSDVEIHEWLSVIKDNLLGRNQSWLRYLLVKTPPETMRAVANQLLKRRFHVEALSLMENVWRMEMANHIDIHGLADWWPDWFVPSPTAYGTVLADPVNVSWRLSEEHPIVKRADFRSALRQMAASGGWQLMAGIISERIGSEGNPEILFEISRIQIMTQFVPPDNLTRTLGPSYDLISVRADWTLKVLNDYMDGGYQDYMPHIVVALDRSMAL